MRSKVVLSLKRNKDGQFVSSGVGKYIRYYQSLGKRDAPDENCTLEAVQESILKAERVSEVPLTTLKLDNETFSLLANETNPPMTRTGIGTVLGVNVEVIQRDTSKRKKRVINCTKTGDLWVSHRLAKWFEIPAVVHLIHFIRGYIRFHVQYPAAKKLSIGRDSGALTLIGIKHGEAKWLINLCRNKIARTQ